MTQATDGEDGGALSDSAPSEVAQTFVWGTSVNVEDCTQRFRRFVTVGRHSACFPPHDHDVFLFMFYIAPADHIPNVLCFANF